MLEFKDTVELMLAAEKWKGSIIPLHKNQLEDKYDDMAADEWLHFRATFPIFAYNLRRRCKKLLKDKKKIIVIGDAHIENYGSFVDLEDRDNWWCNDVDEAYPSEWLEDPIRQLTSIIVASSKGHLSISASQAEDAILEGYEKGLTKGPKPFILNMKHGKLRELVLMNQRDPRAFWEKILALPKITPPPSAAAVLSAAMPEGTKDITYHGREAGEGSKETPRAVCVGWLHGDPVAREGKMLTPSAHAFLEGIKNPMAHLFYDKILQGAPRRDPYLQIASARNSPRGRLIPWINRRIGPKNCRIELTLLKEHRSAYALVKDMGRELCNMTASDPAVAKAVLAEFGKLKDGWLRKAAQDMAEDNSEAHEVWARYRTRVKNRRPKD